MTLEHDLASKFATWSDLPIRVADAMGAWRLVPYLVEEMPVAVAAIYGSEIHFAIDPAWRGGLLLRERVRNFLRPLMEERGYLTTTSMNERNHDFLERLGFHATWDEADRRHYMMTSLPFAKEH